MSFYWLLVGTLVVWRITHLLSLEDGPWKLMSRLRDRLGQGFFGSLIDCFYCLSVWVAFPFALLIGENWKARLLLWPALSGGAILLERATETETQPTPVYYHEDQEEQKDVLRPAQSPVQPNHS